jgi:retron-type reverse transcriptase
VLEKWFLRSEGRDWVVDIDLEKFFDRVNHDILMAMLAKRIEDKRVLKLIRLSLAKWNHGGRCRNGANGGNSARKPAFTSSVKHHA